MFDFGSFSLFPDAQAVDYEEELFAKQIKKRKKPSSKRIR
jgi:hypothetical protein